MSSVRMGAGWCSIAWVRTSLNLGSGRMYHPRMAKEGGSEKPNEIKPDEY